MGWPDTGSRGASRPHSWLHAAFAVHAKSLAGSRFNRLANLLLDGFQVEARGLLHGWKVDEGLTDLRDLLLDENEPPEFVGEPGILVHGLCRQARALERIETKVH